MIKILHTSDWHIGKKIYGIDLAPDHRLFFQWLIETIVNQEIDVLLISGDVFDLSNPSVESRTIYYDVLVKLRNVGCQVIITGGNHDSAMVLDAPRELLKALNIRVVGGMPQNQEDTVIPLKNRTGEVEAAVVAIPFLREADLQLQLTNDTYESRMEAMRSSVLKIYNQLSTSAELRFPSIPKIAMGHLFGIGASVSESERELMIGNLNMLEVDKITEGIDYMALGHIHRPQKLKSKVPALYSGSPIPLSFSEHYDTKSIILLKVNENKSIDIELINIPEIRKLVRIKGSYSEISSVLENWKNASLGLQSLMELEFVENEHNPVIINQIQELVDSWENTSAKIIKHRVTFKNGNGSQYQWAEENVQIQELNPGDVFLNLLDSVDLQSNQRQLVDKAFRELLAEVHDLEEID
jgi:exonuclease SbcD